MWKQARFHITKQSKEGYFSQKVTSKKRLENHHHRKKVKSVHYARSSSGDKKAIENQFSKLREYYGEPDITISDRASGLNENRKGIRRLIELAQSKDITDIYMVRKDRLTRFGYKYLESLFSQNGVSLHYMTDKSNSSIEQELLDDFMAIIASFSGKYSQLRSQEAKKKLLNKALENVEGKHDE